MSHGTVVRRTLAVAALALATLAPLPAFAACSISESDKDGNGTPDVRVIGDTARQNALIEIHQLNSIAKIDCNANGSYADAVDITKTLAAGTEVYSLELGGGDNVTVQLADDLVGVAKDISMSMGTGSKITFQGQGHSITGSNFEIELLGSAGTENVTLDFTGSAIASSSILIRGDMGAGPDGVKVIGPGSSTDSAMDVNMRMGPGNNVANYVDGGGVLTNSRLDVHFDGDESWTFWDSFLSTFSGQIQDNSRIYFTGLLNAGDDKYTGNFDVATFAIDPLGAAGSEAYFILKGQVGFDNLTISDMAHAGPAKINGDLFIYLDGGNQQDALNLAWNGGVTGTGRMSVWADGAMSYDKINFALVADAASQNVLDLFGTGGPENDLGSPNGDFVTMAVTNNGSATYGPGGYVVLDGGLDTIDTCKFTGNAVHKALNCEAGAW